MRWVVSNAARESAVPCCRASRRGADVELWTGRMSYPVPTTLRRRGFRTVGYPGCRALDYDVSSPC